MALSVSLRFRDPMAGVDIATVTRFSTLQTLKRINDPGLITGTFVDGTAAALVEAAFLATGNLTCYVKHQTGGPETMAGFVTSYDWARWAPAPFSFQATGLFGLLAGVTIDRLTAYSTAGVAYTVQDILDRILLQSLPYVADWADAALLTWTGVAVQGGDLLLSEDINAVNVLQALSSLSRTLGGQLGPDASNWYADTTTRTLYLGRVGFGTSHTFGTDSVIEPAGIRSLGSVAGLVSRLANPVGGSSFHGLPQGGTLTGVAYVPGLGFIVSVYVSSTEGGVYWIDGALNAQPFSQGTAGVNGLCYDRPRNIIYVATDRGIYERRAGDGPGVFKQTGGLTVRADPRAVQTWSGKTTQVWVDGVQVYALASGNATFNGILTYPALGDPAATFGAGYDYWSVVVSHDCVAGTALLGTVYTVDSSDQATVQVLVSAADPFLSNLSTPIRVAIPGAVVGSAGWAVTRMDRAADASGIFVYTTGGNRATYFMAAGTTILQSIDASGSMAAASGGTNVNAIVLGGPTRIAALAATDDGVYATHAFVGPRTSWFPISPAGGLGGRQVTGLAIGDVNTSPDARHTPLLALAAATLYDSNSDGLFWRDILAMPVDLGAFLLNPADSGPVFLGLPSLPPEVAFQTKINDVASGGDGNLTYAAVRVQPPYAPGNASSVEAAPALSADANLSPEAASALLAVGAQRYLAISALASQQVEIASEIVDGNGESVLLLQPTQVAAVAWVGDLCGADLSSAPLATSGKIIEAATTYDAGGLHGRTVLGKQLITQALSFTEIAEDLAFQQSQLARRPSK